MRLKTNAHEVRAKQQLIHLYGVRFKQLAAIEKAQYVRPCCRYRYRQGGVLEIECRSTTYRFRRVRPFGVYVHRKLLFIHCKIGESVAQVRS